MDPGPVGEPKRKERLPPTKAETNAVIASEFEGKKSIFFKPEELDAITNSSLVDKPLGEFISPVQLALELIKERQKALEIIKKRKKG